MGAALTAGMRLGCCACKGSTGLGPASWPTQDPVLLQRAFPLQHTVNVPLRPQHVLTGEQCKSAWYRKAFSCRRMLLVGHLHAE